MKFIEYLKQTESKTFELKRDLSSKKGILKTISAFSNTSGGTLLIGIEDDKTVAGLASPKDDEEKLTSIISDGISPQVLPEIDILSWRDRNVLRVVVYPGPSRPYFLTSTGKEAGTFVRVGSTNRRADDTVIQALTRYSMGRSFDEEPVPEYNSEAIDFLAASELFAETRILRRDDLATLRVVTRALNKVVPTVGGILLFGKVRDELFPDAWLQCGRFRGKDRSVIADTVEYRDHLPNLPYHAMEFFRKHMQTSIHIGEVRNDKHSNFPLVALREAAVNAVVHADYSMTGSPVRISIFDDRIEIENPGLLQFGVTIEDLLNGVSVLRNRVIGRVFKELGLIEQWGSGIQRMIADCSEMGLRPPDFTETGRNFRVTIFTNPIGRSLFDRADSHILRLLRANPDGLSTSELATILDVTGRTVRNRMKSLVEKGLVLPVGTGPRDPRRRYVISDPE
ncbi:MAG: putative DNA binding domain-containing protein [Candidatus Sabulitectum sp.]|nr:putative DNA binding domain-containing protein [Candidatus Sabulitectum sp.]